MDGAAKQQIVDRIKQANNILVTVSTNPSVDQLAACVGLTLLLNKMGKHATAVFSGKVPSTIEFLQPEKTIETTTDSLRDFIISLDKDKADKLRYKVEDQVVKIFITPYKTSLSESDLVFSQGDYNVEVVLALGIVDKAHIDSAITAHGRILHDATVIAVNNLNSKPAGIGQINWLDPSASSLCEMVVSMSEGLGSGLIDNQMATAFLTGIVAETKRFSNQKTSARVMTISAQLMAAGANQQLIASKLEPPAPVVVKESPVQVKVPHGPPPPESTEAKILTDGTMNISHDKDAKKTPALVSTEIHIDEQGNLVTPEEVLPLPDEDKPAAKTEMPEPPLTGTTSPKTQTSSKPAAAIEPPAAKPPGPHTLLDPNVYQPSLDSPFTASTEPGWLAPGASGAPDPLTDGLPSGYMGQAEHVVQPPNNSTPTLTNASAPTVDSARNAVQNAIASSPDGGYEPPRQDLNASFVDLSSAPPAPPPGPPPLMLPATSGKPQA